MSSRATNRIWIGITLAGLLAAVFATTVYPRLARAAEPKNLQVLPNDLSKKQIKTIMKGWAKALGVECDFCHDMDDMAKDTKHKKEAREMVRMTEQINAKHLKKYKTKVTCMTCHRGQEHPKK